MKISQEFHFDGGREKRLINAIHDAFLTTLDDAYESVPGHRYLRAWMNEFLLWNKLQSEAVTGLRKWAKAATATKAKGERRADILGAAGRVKKALEMFDVAAAKAA